MGPMIFADPKGNCILCPALVSPPEEHPMPCIMALDVMYLLFPLEPRSESVVPRECEGPD
jgi:hypothetical protein